MLKILKKWRLCQSLHGKKVRIFLNPKGRDQQKQIIFNQNLGLFNLNESIPTETFLVFTSVRPVD